jgi:hypothetical protein
MLLDLLIRLHRADENSAAEMSGVLDGLRGSHVPRALPSSWFITHGIASRLPSSNWKGFFCEKAIVAMEVTAYRLRSGRDCGDGVGLQ